MTPAGGTISGPCNPSERKLVMETLKCVVEGLGAALGREVEVVLHDLADPARSVVAIANGHLTGRRPGSPIVSGPLDDAGLDKLISSSEADKGQTCTVVTGYRSRTRAGRELDSTTLFLRDAAGTAYAALCVNADRTPLQEIRALVDNLLGVGDARPGDDEPGPVGVETLVEEIIEDGIRSAGRPVSIMTKEDKMEAVRQMNQRGLFLIRSSVDMVAAHLGVSRFTIYNYLDELKKSDQTADGDARAPG